MTLTVIAHDMPATGEFTLAHLLHPLTSQEFHAIYWQRQPLHLTGWTSRFAGVFDLDRLRAALARREQAGLLVRVSSDREGDGGAAAAHVLVDGGDIAQHLQAGASVCVDGLERADPQLAELASTLKRQIGHAGPVSVKSYLSPPGYGFNTHFDAHVVTTLQIEGCKRWRISRTPGVRFPVDNAFLDADGTVRCIGRTPSSLRPWERPEVDQLDFAEVLLRPGDVLCLPAGTWHDAKAVDGHSLALNLSFSTAGVLDLLLDTVTQRLQELPYWRAGLPTVPAIDDPDQPGLPTRVRQYLADRVDDLAAALLAAVDDPAVAARWAAAVRGDQLIATTARASGLAAGSLPTAPPPDGRRLQCVIGVSDSVAAADWYRRVLGCQVVARMPEFGWAELSTPVAGVTLGLTELSETGAGGGAVLDFSVRDVERMRAVLAANGVTITEPVDEIAGVARFLVGHDPDGNRLMFFEPADGTGEEL